MGFAATTAEGPDDDPVTETDRDTDGSPTDRRSHSPWLAAILSLVLAGAGQLYNRQIIRGVLHAVFAAGFWCAGLGWIVHLLAGLDGWMAGSRIREWGLDGRSVRIAARRALEAHPFDPAVHAGEASQEIPPAVRAAQRADRGLRYLARTEAAHGYAGDDTLGAVTSLLQIALFYFEPILYLVLRRRQIAALEALAAFGISPPPE